MRPPHAPVVKRSAPCIAPARKPPSGRAFSCARRPVAAVGSSVLPTQHGGSWPLGSCAPSPTAPTAPGWCLLLSHPPEHAHTYTRGLWAPQVLCFLSLRGALLVRRCPMRPACWRLQSPALLTARFPRILRAPWSLHRLRARSRACRLCGSPTTPHNRPERPDWRIATAAGLSHTEAKWLSLWAVGSRQASCGAWEGTATPTGPWTPLFRRGARSRRRCACLPRPCCGQICPPSSHPHLCNTPQTAPVCPPAHPVPVGCVDAGKAG